MVSDTAKQLPFSAWIRRIAAALLMVSYLPLAIGLIQMAVIPSKYLAVVLPVYGVLLAGLVWLLLGVGRFKKRPLLVGIVMISVLLSMLNIVAYSVVRSTDGLLGSVQSSQATYIEYVIVAKKGQNVKVDSASSIGTIKEDPLYEQSGRALAQETQAQQYPYGTLMDLADAVKSDAVTLGSMRQASLQLLRDNYPEFYDSTVVLATYRVKADDRSTAQADVTKPFVLYISGIDTYDEVSTVSRSDVNMLAVVNPQKGTILLVNTPRDYYVQLHGTTGSRDKLTHAGIYGIDMSRQTLQDLYGTEIAYYARINFTSLVKVIDTIGPIDVYSDYAFKSYKAGYNTLDSKQALEFARERYSFEEGDRQRGRNQQHVIEAIVAKVSKLQNAVYMNQILAAVAGSMETNMSEQNLKKLIREQLDDLKSWTTTSISVDGAGATQGTYSMGAQPLYVMIPDELSLSRAKQQITDALSK